MRPTPEVIGEIFGGVRLETASPEASSAARLWRPEAVVAEAFDTVGGSIASGGGAVHRVDVAAESVAVLFEERDTFDHLVVLFDEHGS
ncbi:hypothetical protein FAIPA1_10328 [Frankia sp. AiPs1]